jgi:HPt (histidine-containing phosphotransfer) domain-containing protein
MNDYITKPFTEGQLIESIQLQLKREGGLVNLSSAGAKHDDMSEVAEAFESLKADLGRESMLILRNALQTKLPDYITKLKAYSAAESYSDLQHLAHTLCGSMSSLRLKNGHSIAVNLEKAAKQKETDKIAPLSDELLVYFKKLQEEISSVQ